MKHFNKFFLIILGIAIAITGSSVFAQFEEIIEPTPKIIAENQFQITNPLDRENKTQYSIEELILNEQRKTNEYLDIISQTLVKIKNK